MFKKKKIIILTLSFLIMWMMSLVYISSVVNEDKIRSVANSFVQSQVGTMNVEIGKIQYSIFPTIKIHLEKFQVNNSSIKKSQLLSLGDVEVKLSIATYILKKGIIDIKSNDLTIFYDTESEKNNWSKFQAIKDNSPLLSNLKINFKTENANFKISNAERKTSNIHLSKLIVKGIQPNNNPAFEAVVQLGDNTSQNSIRGTLACIGDINLEKLIYKRSIDMNLFMSADNLQIQNKMVQLPALRLRSKIQSDNLDSFQAQTSVELGSFMSGTTQVVYDGEKFLFNQFEFTLLPKDGAIYFGNFIESNLTNYIKDSNFELQFVGSLVWDFKQLSPDFKFSSTNNFNFYLSDNFVLKSNLEGVLSDNNFSMVLRSSAGSSNLVFSFTNINNVLNTNFTSDGFELSAKQVQPLMSFIQEVLPTRNSLKQSDNYFDQLIAEMQMQIRSKNLLVDFSNVVVQKLSDEKFSLLLRISSDVKQDEIKKMLLISEDGSLVWQNAKSKNKQGEFVIKDFRLSNLLSYVANPLAGFDGIVNGKLKASFTRVANLAFDGLLSIKDFSIESFDIAKSLKTELEQVGFDPVKLEKNKWPLGIDELSLKLSLLDHKMKISNIKLSDKTQTTVLVGNIKEDKKGVALDMQVPAFLMSDTKRILKRNTIPVDVILDDTVLGSTISPKIMIPLSKALNN
jgi:hypothetical protein